MSKIDEINDCVDALSRRFDDLASRKDATKASFALLEKLNKIRRKFEHPPFSAYEFDEKELKEEIKAAERVMGQTDPWKYDRRHAG